MSRLNVSDLGVMETVTADKTSLHIDALEAKVDRLEEENAQLRLALSSKPKDLISEEALTKLRKNYHELLDETIPF